MNGASAVAQVPVAGTAPDAKSENLQLIDRITYLASLASRFEDVDPMMDTLRSVTAKWSRAEPLVPEELKKLQNLERDLKTYLITKDPVRAFTAESLEQRLAGRTHKNGVNPVTRSAIFIVLVSVVATALCYLPFIPIPEENRHFLAIPMFFVVLHIGISWLYLTALKNVNTEVRKAFKLVTVAVMLFSLAFSQYVVIAAFKEQLDGSLVSTYVTTWLVAAPFFFIYFGMRAYARQLGINTWVSKLPIVAAVWAAVVVLRILFTHDATDPDFYGWAPAAITFTLFAFLSLLLVHKIRKVVTSGYARPMTWMYVYLVVNMLASISANLPSLPGGGDGGMHVYVLMVIFGVPVQLLLLMTGYSFKKELSK